MSRYLFTKSFRFNTKSNPAYRITDLHTMESWTEYMSLLDIQDKYQDIEYVIFKKDVDKQKQLVSGNPYSEYSRASDRYLSTNKDD